MRSSPWSDCGRLFIAYGLTAIGVGVLLVWETIDRLAARATPKSAPQRPVVLHESPLDDLRHVTG